MTVEKQKLNGSLKNEFFNERCFINSHLTKLYKQLDSNKKYVFIKTLDSDTLSQRVLIQEKDFLSSSELTLNSIERLLSIFPKPISFLS